MQEAYLCQVLIKKYVFFSLATHVAEVIRGMGSASFAIARMKISQG